MVAKQQQQTYSSLEPSPSHELRLRQERRHGHLFISFFSNESRKIDLLRCCRSSILVEPWLVSLPSTQLFWLFQVGPYVNSDGPVRHPQVSSIAVYLKLSTVFPQKAEVS